MPVLMNKFSFSCDINLYPILNGNSNNLIETDFTFTNSYVNLCFGGGKALWFKKTWVVNFREI